MSAALIDLTRLFNGLWHSDGQRVVTLKEVIYNRFYAEMVKLLYHTLKLLNTCSKKKSKLVLNVYYIMEMLPISRPLSEKIVQFALLVLPPRPMAYRHPRRVSSPSSMRSYVAKIIIVL